MTYKGVDVDPRTLSVTEGHSSKHTRPVGQCGKRVHDPPTKHEGSIHFVFRIVPVSLVGALPFRDDKSFLVHVLYDNSTMISST